MLCFYFQLDSRPLSRSKPLPPKKPERLSLQRATSLLSVDQVVSSSRSQRNTIEPTHEEQPNSSQLWKSTGNGLNSEHIESLPSFPSSLKTGHFVSSKFRSEFVPRRESSPLPTNMNSSRRNTYSDRLNEKCQYPDDGRIHAREVNLIIRDDSSLKESFDYNNEKESNRYPISCSWTPLDRRDSSSPCLTTSSSSYHTPSSGGSPCGSGGRPVTLHETSPLEETFNCSGPDSSSNHTTNISTSSTTPTNTPISSPLKMADVSNLQSPFVNTINKGIKSDYTLVHAEPTYGYLPFKQNNQFGGNFRNMKNNISLSSKHNIQKNYNTAIKQQKYEAFTSRNESPITSSNCAEKYSHSGSQAKENYPVKSYIYGNELSPKFQTYSSLKRQTGKVVNDLGYQAPSTPMTPRSNSALKVRGSMNGEEDWC